MDLIHLGKDTSIKLKICSKTYAAFEDDNQIDVSNIWDGTTNFFEQYHVCKSY